MLAPVSYTHLDVYKRQGVDSVTDSLLRCRTRRQEFVVLNEAAKPSLNINTEVIVLENIIFYGAVLAVVKSYCTDVLDFVFAGINNFEAF